MFKEIDPQPNFPKIEEEILNFWQKNEIFEKSLKKNDPQNKFIFYEGPPTANGQPGIHHVLARVFKDIICRYKTMQGFYVGRRAGWDTHGLPVEIEVEKALGLKDKKEIEAYGVAKFNEKCRMSVFRYKKEWEDLTLRIGFWLDLENPYITYENSYIEKVWGVLKQIWEKDLIYQGFKVVPYCPRCGTTLSSHEVAQGYRNITENSYFIKFPLKNKKNTFFLVWTTTPWTLPGNIALAVNPEINYVEVASNGETLILAKDRVSKVIKGEYKIVKEFKGSDLVGETYEALYDPSDFIKTTNKDFKVWSADFVLADDGTGIVHIAPAFGVDDMNLQNKEGFSIPMTVSPEGKMLSEIGKGKFVKDADPEIIEDLKSRRLFFADEKITHEYPFCWRCESILIYFAKSTWFIKVSKINDKLLKNNEEINWIPDYLKHGRFGQWLTDARDWALSRERFWGTPLPIWQCECGEKILIGSLEELKKMATEPVKDDLDLHKPYIDEITIKCDQCDGVMKRVPEVIDVWFDSGAMPFASGEFPDNFPADYISEAIDQTRGWFYTMLSISTLLDQAAPYKNVISLAHVLDENGKKMSKSKGNVIDPWKVINKFGTDSLRWYFYTVNSPGDSKRMAEKDVEQTLRKFVMLLFNIYLFFTSYANIDDWTLEKQEKSDNILDKWIIAELNLLTQKTINNLDEFNITGAAREIHKFNNDLSTWYLRRSRKRRDGEFYSTLYYVLLDLSKLLAPFIPFTAESIYQNLKTSKDPESVHLCDWPKAGEIDENLISQMAEIRKLVETAHAQRAEAKIKNRQPLQCAKIKKEFSQDLLEILKSELNVKDIIIDGRQKEEIVLDTEITEELKKEGICRDLLRLIQDLRKKAKLVSGNPANLYCQGDEEILQLIKENQKNIEKETTVKLVFQKQDNVEIGEKNTLDGKTIWLGLTKE